MLWRQIYTPTGEIASSALIAGVPILVLFALLGILKRPPWLAAACGLASAAAVAILAYRMPWVPMVSAAGYGAAFGLFPIGWIVFTAILLFNLTIETGQFEILKQSLASITENRSLLILLVAFAFGAFLEGAAGFGAPVAIAASMLVALGFEPFLAAAACLMANTAPVAFGSIGIPLQTLAAVTGLPLARLSAEAGRLCAPVSTFVPAYLVLTLCGWRAFRSVWKSALACGFAFGFTQLLVSNLIGPELTDILSSLAAMFVLLIAERLGRRRRLESNNPPRAIARAWLPYAFLVLLVLLWGIRPVQAGLQQVTVRFPWPALNGRVERVPPAVAHASVYGAIYSLNWLSAAGTACLLAGIASAISLRVSARTYTRVLWQTARQLWIAELTIALMLALAFLMNYSGSTTTLGLALAGTGRVFPFFSAFLGWLGVFLTGSDTSANALFGNLQVVSAQRLGLDPTLTAAANSIGGVMGKMISLASIAVAAAATALAPGDDSRLFRFTLRHSLALASFVGLLTLLYAQFR